MTDLTFRTPLATPPVAPPDAPQDGGANDRGGQVSLGTEEPVTGLKAEETVLSLLGVDDATGIPPEDLSNLKDVTEYVAKLVEQKGAVPTRSTMRRAIEGLKQELELDPQAEPGAVLERVGKVISAWKGLTFIRDTTERRRIFMKLARLPDSRSIDDALFAEMESRGVYR